MRRRRLKAPASWDRAFYHCISRVVDRRFAFGDEDHAEFIRFMRQYEKFCQVKVLTYCLMSNHFHLLVEVPARPADNMTEDALCQNVRSCFGDAKADHLRVPSPSRVGQVIRPSNPGRVPLSISISSFKSPSSFLP